MAWKHQGWTGLCYLPGADKEPERKRLGWTPGGVTCTFAGSPSQAAGIRTGDVVLAVNGVPAGDHQQLAQLDAQLKLNDEVTYRIQHKDGSQATTRMRLDSPVRSSQIQVSTFTGFGAALVFFALGSLVYWRKPEDRRALIFYLLSLVATICAATTPLLYVDVLAARGARPVFMFTPTEAVLWTALALVEFTVLALVVHFALIFPRPRPFVQRNPQALRWLYLAPLLDLINCSDLCGVQPSRVCSTARARELVDPGADAAGISRKGCAFIRLEGCWLCLPRSNKA
jgi:hypothetical protein